jgi:hypothetical protein
MVNAVWSNVPYRVRGGTVVTCMTHICTGDMHGSAHTDTTRNDKQGASACQRLTVMFASASLCKYGPCLLSARTAPDQQLSGAPPGIPQHSTSTYCTIRRQSLFSMHVRTTRDPCRVIRSTNHHVAVVVLSNKLKGLLLLLT